MKIFTTFFVSIGLILSPVSVFAENDPSSKYRVLSTENSGLSLLTINYLLDQAEEAYKLFDKQADGKGVIIP